MSIKKMSAVLFLAVLCLCFFSPGNSPVSFAAIREDEASQAKEQVLETEQEIEEPFKESSSGDAKKAASNSSESTAAQEDSKKEAEPSIKLNRSKKSLEKGRTFQIKAKVKHAKKKKVIYKSSDKSVAAVNKKGVVTAKDKGKTVITAKIKGTNVKATCVVKVKNYVTMRMRTTGYCNCSRCAGPWAGCRTASGTIPRAKHTIAVDKNLIKMGTKVKIGNTMYVAEDTGSAIRGHRIDVYYSSHRQAQAHGVKYQNVKVYL